MIVARALAFDRRLFPTDLQLAGGQAVALIGPNGGGKTSLLRTLACVHGAGGTVEIDGHVVRSASSAHRRRLVGLLPASRSLHWPIAVRDVIALGLDRPDPGRVAELVDALELRPLAERPADQLSTGERARVLMARVLASRPALLLLDEPLANLDPYWALRFLDLINAEASRGATVVVALHDLAQIARFDRVLLVNEGRLLRDETPAQLLAAPAFEEVFRVIKSDGGFAISPTAGRRSSQ